MHAIRIAKGFGMEVLAHDLHQNQLLADVLGFGYVELDELLETSGIVSLHAPATPATHYLVNRETLNWALDEGILAGAGLDDFEGEEFSAHEDELLSQPEAEEKLRAIMRGHSL